MPDDAGKTANCYDCERPYSDPGFVDLVVPNEIWRQISPTGDEGGLLCPSCLIARLATAGIECDGMLTSGPIRLANYQPFSAIREARQQERAACAEIAQTYEDWCANWGEISNEIAARGCAAEIADAIEARATEETK